MSTKLSKQMDNQLSELNSKIEDGQRQISDLQSQKNRLQNEAAETTRQLEEAEHKVGQLTKDKNALQNALEDTKRSLEDETRVIHHLQIPLIIIIHSVLDTYTGFRGALMAIILMRINRTVLK